MCRWTDEGWTAPKLMPLNPEGDADEPSVAPDGRSIHFAPYDEGMDVRIWTVDRTAGGWSSPRQLGPPLADDPAFFPTATLDGEIYYTNLAAREVYRAKMAGDTVEMVEDAGLEFGDARFPDNV